MQSNSNKWRREVGIDNLLEEEEAREERRIKRKKKGLSDEGLLFIRGMGVVMSVVSLSLSLSLSICIYIYI